MSKKADKENKVQLWRILQIDKELRAGACPTTGKLAEQFGVCRRTVERECEPYHVVCQRGLWYVIGRRRLRQELRIFSLSRIQHITALSEEPPFSVPENFSAESCIDTHIGVWMNRQN
ncbi:MAG: helix-turn-helix transcriptional regulator [Treponema sp.]|uniref:helix-turn-helix transcriptional regulator n=1 Tax=Treponema sp. TaxID=166 RepID=UPI003FA2E484